MSYAATIGFFDGVHRGHRQVISRLQAIAEAEQLLSMVITFSNHPMEIVCPERVPELLIPCDEKLSRLRQTGVNRVEALCFTREMMQQSARDFMEHTLRDRLDVRLLMIGYDNRFGRRNPAETFETYVEYGRELGIKVVEGPRPEDCGLFEGQPVSSSLIRQLMQEGRTAEAETLLSY